MDTGKFEPARKPLLSVVATTRNDDHGGDMQSRLQAFVSCLFWQARRARVPVELVLVEWNPPEDRQPLLDAVDWSDVAGPSYVRIIRVPRNVHQSLEASEGLPLFQMLAKNVGIRRAQADWILATNVDVLVSQQMFDKITSPRLRKDTLYRAIRVDVHPDIPSARDVEALLRHCERRQTRHNLIWGSKSFVDGKFYRVFARDHRQFAQKYLLPRQVFTNACGDFQLAHRSVWSELRGYPEFECFSLHLDSLFEYSAVHHGCKEVTFSKTVPLFHIDHSHGFLPEAGATNDFHQKFARVPRFDYAMIEAMAMAMEVLNRNFQFNDETWGFGDIEFDCDCVLGSGERRTVRQETIENVGGGTAAATQAWFPFARGLADEVIRCRYVSLECYLNVLRDRMVLSKGRERPPELGAQNVSRPAPRKIIVFGAGSGYIRYVAEPLRGLGHPPAFLVDNDEAKHGTRGDGLQVCPVEVLRGEDPANTVVLVATMFYRQALRQLQGLGWTEYENIVNGVFKENPFQIRIGDASCKRLRELALSMKNYEPSQTAKEG